MFALILSAIFSFVGPDQASPWPYQHISKKDGLSNSAINSIYMDRDQYVWFGTWDGLNRYDGTSLKIYTPDSFVKGTISNNVIRNIVEDKDGNLWIITHHGINLYDRDRDTFTTYFTDLGGFPVQEYNIRVCLGPDSLIWTNVIGQGVSRYNASTKAFDPVKIQGLTGEWMTQVIGLGSASGMIYLLHSSGELVTAINGKILYRKKVSNPMDIRTHYFFNAHGTTFLITTSSSDSNLKIFDLSNLDAAPKIVKLNNTSVSCISANKKQDALWIGTETGNIFKINFFGDITLENMSGYFPQFEKSQRKILSICETAQDLLWVGTDGDGIFKFLTKQKPFRALTSGAENNTLSNSIVRSVFETEDGTLYIGTRSGGLNILNNTLQNRRIINTSEGLSNSTVLSIAKDKHGNTWIGTDGEGINMIESSTNRVLHFPRDFANATPIRFAHVYDICIDVYGTLWIGTSGHGVIQMKISKKSGKYFLDDFKQVSYAPDEGKKSINSNIVYSIVEEMPNILWFGTRGAGVYRYNTITHQIEAHIHTGSPERQRLSNDDVLGMHKDANDNLWIGTSGGLNKIKLERPAYHTTRYTNYEGLPNNTIHGILEDDNHTIWLSTNNGLIMFDQQENTFKTFDSNDGLLNNEFTDGAFFKSQLSNRLYFGGINGLDIIYPDQIDTTTTFPRLSVSQFQIHNIIVTPSDSIGILPRRVDITNTIELDYDQNFFSFHFTTLDYWNKQRTEYAYFLENFDKDWNYIGKQNVVNLTNVPPGDYTLKINYSKNGEWNPVPREIHITVNPPFWKTSWAYGLYVILLIGIQLTIILYIRDKAKTKRAAAINQFKMQQMEELNDYKLQFFTNVAHEFRTPLTLILGPVSTLIKKSTSLWEKSMLRTIYNNSIRMQKLIDELLHFRKIESGKDDLRVAETDLISFTQTIVDSFLQHATDHDVHLEYIPEPETLKGWVDKRKMEKVLINLISNAIKYNVKGGTVDVRLSTNQNKAVFSISDTGIGIQKDLQPKIFQVFYNNPNQESFIHESSTGIGLSLTRSLVNIHHGTIELHSEPGIGTTIVVQIPITKDDYATGLHDDQVVVFHGTNLDEKVSQEFSRTADASGLVPLEVTREKERSHSILVVDDNEQIMILLKNILSDKYHIITASRGAEALRILEDEKIDLVISDILMPGMDGLTLCRSIKDNIQTSHIPVILLTAKGEIEDRIEGLQVGADSYIPKPFHPEHLFTRIEKLIINREQARTRFANLAHIELTDISTGMGEKDDQFFSKITQCIHDHLAEPEFSADDIAREVGLSKASLYKKVKAITNLTPHGLIKQYRLKKAADLLRTTTMSVSEVIDQTGFNSRSYFYKSFNEMFHCHPKDFGSKAG